MSEKLSLLAAILLGRARGRSDLDRHMRAANAAGIDIIDYCVHHCGLSDAEVMARAARWAGIAFSPAIPHTMSGVPALPRLEHLATARSVRGWLYDREVVYAAPRFAEFISLADRVASDPEFHRNFCVVPGRVLREELVSASAGPLSDAASERLSARWPRASARTELTYANRVIFVLGLLAAILAAAAAPFVLKPVLVPVLALVVLVPAVLRLAAAFVPNMAGADPPPLADRDLPIYTVLVPLRDEAHMVAQLAAALRALDYPSERLDIAFVVEGDCDSTLAAVRAELADPRFRLVEVPPAQPRTKPKAMNYALPTSRGSLVAVYDAEDIPEPDQLRLAASLFASRPDLDCLQAELVIENAGENNLTALFAGEYAGQFGLMLPLLSRLHLPMPLGGTSNHFRVDALREIGGWDAHNVTEDADLGVRFSRLRFRTGTIASQTLEEAPVSLDAWLRQRTRWMKGWMQTFIVHNRKPGRFLADIGWRGFVGFQLYVGSQILSGPLHTAFLVSLLVNIALQRPLYFDVWDTATIAIFVVGYSGAFAMVIAGLLRLGRHDLLARQLWLPAYWVLHSLAAARAAVELLRQPYFWAKTRHGATRQPRHASAAITPLPVQAELRDRPRSEVSISGSRPAIRSARTRPDPAAMVQPSVPCPVLK